MKLPFTRIVLIFSTCIIGWAIFFFYLFSYYISEKSSVSDKISNDFRIVLDEATITFTICFSMFWLLYIISTRFKGWFFTFINLEGVKLGFKFPVLSAFVGEQAFSSLLGTILIDYSKVIYNQFGILSISFLSSVVIAFMLCFSSVSLCRFIYSFKENGILKIAFVSIASTLFMFLMLIYGMTQ